MHEVFTRGTRDDGGAASYALDPRDGHAPVASEGDEAASSFVPAETDAAKPFVSVVVPAFNDAARLALCLDALERQTYPKDSYEVVVVDNGSDEPVAPLVARFPSARSCAEPRPGSYAARNKGLQLARGDVLAFTDADCIPAADWIEKGVAALHSSGPARGLVAGRVEVFIEDARRASAVELYESMTALAQKTYVEQGRFGATANLFTFRSVFERAGLFDAALMSGGDVEWGQRVASLGYDIAYSDEARVAHPARRTLGHLYGRVARVMGGFHELARSNRGRYIALGRGFLRDSLPPLRASLSVLRGPRPERLADRLKVVGVMFFVQYAQVWELLRLKAGRPPRR